MEVAGIDLGNWRIDPLLGFRQFHFGIAHGIEILLERLLDLAWKGDFSSELVFAMSKSRALLLLARRA